MCRSTIIHRKLFVSFFVHFIRPIPPAPPNRVINTDLKSESTLHSSIILLWVIHSQRTAIPMCKMTLKKNKSNFRFEVDWIYSHHKIAAIKYSFNKQACRFNREWSPVTVWKTANSSAERQCFPKRHAPCLSLYLIIKIINKSKAISACNSPTISQDFRNEEANVDEADEAHLTSDIITS